MYHSVTSNKKFKGNSPFGRTFLGQIIINEQHNHNTRGSPEYLLGSGVSLFGGVSLFVYIQNFTFKCKFPCTIIQYVKVPIQYVKVPMPAHRFKSSDWSIP